MADSPAIKTADQPAIPAHGESPSAVDKTEQLGALLSSGAWDHLKNHKSEIAIQAVQGAIMGAALASAPRWLALGVGAIGTYTLGKHFYHQAADLLPAVGQLWHGNARDAKAAEQTVRQAGGGLLIDAAVTGLSGWGTAKLMTAFGGRAVAAGRAGAGGTDIGAVDIRPVDIGGVDSRVSTAFTGATKSGVLLERTGSTPNMVRGTIEPLTLQQASLANTLAELSDGRLQTVLSTGKAEVRSQLDTPGQVVGTFAFDSRAMNAAHDAFSNVLVGMRDLAPEHAPTRAAQIGQLGQEIETHVLPNLQRAGVRVIQHNMDNAGWFANWFDVPLNRRFPAAEGSVDINSVGGLRQVPELNVTQIFEPVAISKLSPNAAVPASVKYPFLFDQTSSSRLASRPLLDPQFIQALRNGIDQHANVGMGVAVPALQAGRPSSDRNLYVAVEEITHLFQSLNGNRPLSRLGASVQSEMTNNFRRINQLANPVRHSEIVEYDFPGVLQEFGVKLPNSLLEPYNRGLIFDYINATPAKQAEIGGILDELEKPAFAKLTLDQRNQFLRNVLAKKD